MLLLVLNTIAGVIAGFIYILWGIKYLRRKEPLIALLNFAIAAVVLVLGAGYAALGIVPGKVDPVRHLRPLVPLILLLPAATRWLELRREEYREAVAVEFKRELHNKTKEI
ncbi:MAG: hypothetical protein LC687_00355 [Actinobacteria bacterium]|nr:hypothetical protein [Actinomycetota bacterium]